MTGPINGNVLSVRFKAGNTGQQIDTDYAKSGNQFHRMNHSAISSMMISINLSTTRKRRLASSITFFSLIALALTCMGILGQVFMICLSRVKEIGIRKINGAKISEVLLMLNRDFIKWFVLAFLTATPVSWFITHKWLENFAYKTSLNWWIFAIAGVIALMIIIVTVSWTSWHAAIRNPVEALRYLSNPPPKPPRGG